VKTLLILLGVVLLLAALLLFGLFAMSGGSDCAVSAEECERISAAFGIAALVFVGLSVASFWKAAVAGRSTGGANKLED
jgi:FtsH-binding integral membrane protein